MHTTAFDFNAESGEKCDPDMEVDGRAYINANDMGYICLHVSEEYSSAWS